MRDMNAIFAGFGGQGILFMGKVVAYAGLYQEKEVTWMPSYGPEMRGGAANCTVRISDEAVDSPLVNYPNTLVVMNLPSFDLFIDKVRPGGVAIIDSALVDKRVERDDIDVHYVPATALAEENGLSGLANIVLMGKLMQVTDFCSYEMMQRTIEKIVPASKPHLVEKNMQAVSLGMNYQN